MDAKVSVHASFHVTVHVSNDCEEVKDKFVIRMTKCKKIELWFFFWILEGVWSTDPSLYKKGENEVIESLERL